MLLYGKPVLESLGKELLQKRECFFGGIVPYVAIIYLWDNPSSAVYVRNKRRFWDRIGLPVVVFGQGSMSAFLAKDNWLSLSKNPSKAELLSLIQSLNQDERCVGIMVQMPLPSALSKDKDELFATIAVEKDIDGQTGVLSGQSFFDMIDFMPPTIQAVFHLLDFYNLWDPKGKQVAVIGKGNVVGKPLALELLKRGAIVGMFDERDDPKDIKSFTQSSSYIFSWTGQAHLIDCSYINDKKNQILVDIWYGHKDGKAVGDMQRELLQNKVLHITPVPWGVGPLTIASLFANVFRLWEYFHQ